MFESIGIDVGIPVLLLMVLVIILLFTVMNLSMKLNRLNQKYKTFMKGKDGHSLEKEFNLRFKEIDKLMKQSAIHQEDIEEIRRTLDRSPRKYGIVSYDAFDDVGGKLSFALAMLDKDNTGFILDAIHSRENCFLYIKEVVKGESYIMLSEEEVAALKRAVNSELAEE